MSREEGEWYVDGIGEIRYLKVHRSDSNDEVEEGGWELRR